MFTIQEIKQRYSPQDVESFIKDFKNQNNPRYDSFDYCYGYFQNNKTRLANNMEQSCMALWSYLASWGMLRGSSILLQKGNYKVLDETVNVIQRYFNRPHTLPDIANDTRNDYVDKVVNLCKAIEGSLKKGMPQLNPTNTLVTKIILGVFGVFPALDQFFRKSFGDGTSIKGYAGIVWEFYHSNRYKSVIDKFKVEVKSFSGQPSSLFYPVAKLIDMFGFTYGMKKQ